MTPLFSPHLLLLLHRLLLLVVFLFDCCVTQSPRDICSCRNLYAQDLLCNGDFIIKAQIEQKLPLDSLQIEALQQDVIPYRVTILESLKFRPQWYQNRTRVTQRLNFMLTPGCRHRNFNSVAPHERYIISGFMVRGKLVVNTCNFVEKASDLTPIQIFALYQGFYSLYCSQMRYHCRISGTHVHYPLNTRACWIPDDIIDGIDECYSRHALCLQLGGACQFVSNLKYLIERTAMFSISSYAELSSSRYSAIASISGLRNSNNNRRNKNKNRNTLYATEDADGEETELRKRSKPLEDCLQTVRLRRRLL